MARKRQQTQHQHPSLSDLIAREYVAEYEQLHWERQSLQRDTDAAAKRVQLTLITRAIAIAVVLFVGLVWGPWTVLWWWSSGSSFRIWTLPPPPLPSLDTIRAGLMLTGAMGIAYVLITRISDAARAASAHAARRDPGGASAQSDRAERASSA